jgi:hypothetical protein
MQVSGERRDVSGGCKVDVTRGSPALWSPQAAPYVVVIETPDIAAMPLPQILQLRTNATVRFVENIAIRGR